MTDADFTQIKYWMDLLVKAMIGIVVSIVGMDYRAMRTRLDELHESKYSMATEIQVMGSELTSIKGQLNRIDEKLDRVMRR